MKIGDIVIDRLTGKKCRIVDILNKDKTLLLVNYDGKGEIVVTREELGQWDT